MPIALSEKLQRMNEQTDHPINGRVSPSLHPRMLDDVGPVLVDQENSGCSIDGYAAGRGALKALYSSADAIQKAVRRPPVAAPARASRTPLRAELSLDRLIAACYVRRGAEAFVTADVQFVQDADGCRHLPSSN